MSGNCILNMKQVKINIILIVSLCLFFSAAHTAEVTSHPLATAEQFERDLPPLPEKIDSLESLQLYAAHYALAAHNQSMLRVNAGEKLPLSPLGSPCIILENVDHLFCAESPFRRLEKVFAKTSGANLLSVVPEFNLLQLDKAQFGCSQLFFGVASW